jgi:hypothetical protein
VTAVGAFAAAAQNPPTTALRDPVRTSSASSADESRCVRKATYVLLK